MRNKVSMDKLALNLFGMEPDLYGSLDTSEKGQYRFAASLFLFSSIVVLISLIFGFYQMSSSYLVAAIGGFILSFIIISMNRFSLVTIRLPLFGLQFERANGVPAKQTVQMDEKAVEKKVNRFNLIKNKLKSGFSSLKGKFQIQSLLRGIIFLVIIQVPVFFTVVLLNWSKASQHISERRNQAIRSFEVSTKDYGKGLVSNYDARIDQVKMRLNSFEQSIGKESISYQNCLREISRLESYRNQLEKDRQIENQRKFAAFGVKVNKSFYIISLARVLLKSTSYLIVESIFFILFFTPIWILNKLKRKQQVYQYNLKSALDFREKIIQDYYLTEKALQPYFEFYKIDNSILKPFEDYPFKSKPRFGLEENRSQIELNTILTNAI